MSELREALQTILRVNFREHVPATDQAKIGDFLERAAQEILQREENVSLREQKVSQREADATVREHDVSEQTKAIVSLRRVQKTLELRPVRKSWLRRG